MFCFFYTKIARITFVNNLYNYFSCDDFTFRWT